MSQQFGLGKGLSSLIPNKQSAQISQDDFSKRVIGASDDPIRGDKYVIEVDVNQIVANPLQPRKNFDDEKLADLANSIKTHGIIQPLIVTKNGNRYELIAGERRLQAAQLVGLKKVPVIIRDSSELQKLELAIVENIQRHDLNPIEEGKAYQKLIDDFDMSQEEVASKMGKSRSLVANKVRLLSLPVEIQKGLIEGKITEGHAKAILSIPNPEKQRALYELILKSNLTVRQIEDKTKEISVRPHKRQIAVDPQVKEVENALVEALGTKVKISKAGDGGKIVIEYYSKEDLESLLNKLAQRKASNH
ncbi:MAG TPA: ParB/RepB/Spo0J family partition protein [Candidatus Moranbacteria bacterium]|jgi:ParB family chromosome partitioning protein|nr:ParB/RepB/Spo0J family partition protein [Candidatus Moranbacteria bacterium]HOF42243.1 ParB/RepB/Spo0J family partition protein [Candidatus Moranbacteria bacterium]HPX94357.1 ParB/RepB/Spo0J family partition protein [Candidatus Moranbacteria bacterium]HQB59486.1 ParB/RepB/Spo0J family partition protein [Candidatus Moranbacteria bacterium]